MARAGSLCGNQESSLETRWLHQALFSDWTRVRALHGEASKQFNTVALLGVLGRATMTG